MKRVAENIIMSHTLRAYLAWTLVFSCFLMGILYIYLVIKPAFYALEAKQFSVSIGKTTAELNALQAKYISLQSTATIARARELGLSETSNQKYISRKSLSSTLSLRDEI